MSETKYMGIIDEILSDVRSEPDWAGLSAGGDLPHYVILLAEEVEVRRAEVAALGAKLAVQAGAAKAYNEHGDELIASLRADKDAYHAEVADLKAKLAEPWQRKAAEWLRGEAKKFRFGELYPDVMADAADQLEAEAQEAE